MCLDVNLKEIGPVVIELWGVENGELAVHVNNTLVRHTAFLAADMTVCLDTLHWLVSTYTTNLNYEISKLESPNKDITNLSIVEAI